MKYSELVGLPLALVFIPPNDQEEWGLLIGKVLSKSGAYYLDDGEEEVLLTPEWEKLIAKASDDIRPEIMNTEYFIPIPMEV
ncbi:MAG: hypothetical protein HN509_14725 [Halobacteriovoraceae bacterium]|jgi:hypothetical protein|nr:hypothetical protein [Halobacteriovoraceae bacterium]MBT5093203.1 hypothetical protein [Halobacteriovoraceae bacterium]